MKHLYRALPLLLLPAWAGAGPALTVYNSDLAVVREQRSFDLKAGVQSLRYSGVAARIDPTSVQLQGPGLRLLEQDFDYDLVSADRVLEKYLDQDLKAVGKDGRSYEGQLLAYEGGQLMLRGANGRVQMLNRNELSSIDLPGLPGGLLTRPTLVWKVDSEKAGKQGLGLTYMTGGLSWHAEYVVTLAEDEKTLGVNAWVSLDNQSGATYEDARLKLVAGDVNRAGGAPSPRALMSMAKADMAPAAPAFQERSFGEYHLYTLGWPVTLKQASVKQVELLSAKNVPVRKAYTFDGERGGPKVAVQLELVNKEANGLGMPLPAGKWRVFKSDAKEGSEFVGEDSLDHTASDEKLRVKMGDAFDVVGERTVLEERPSAKGNETERQVRIELRNRKKEAVKVQIVEHAFGRWELLDGGQEWKRKSSDTFEREVLLEAGAELKWEYKVRMRY
jgi:hypothetical protein